MVVKASATVAIVGQFTGQLRIARLVLAEVLGELAGAEVGHPDLAIHPSKSS